MENPDTRGKAERVVEQALDEFHASRAKLITDPTKIMFRPSLPKLITNALREAGLLEEEQ